MAGYDAFISYAQAHDRVLSEALERDLRRFARQWNRLWSVRVFRDVSNLSVTPNLWEGVERALLDSRYLLLLASPDAAKSKWVAREVESFLDHRGPESILIVLTAGEIKWDEDAGDFDWSATTALPRTLKGRSTHEPKYLDLRWASNRPGLGRRESAWMDAIADLSAVLQDRPKDELFGDDARQRRRQRTILGSAVAALVLAPLLTIGVSTMFSITAHRDADEQVRTLEAQSSRRAKELLEAQSAMERGDVAQALDIYGQLSMGLYGAEGDAIKTKYNQLLEQVLRDDPTFELPNWKASYHLLGISRGILWSAGDRVRHRVENMLSYLAGLISQHKARTSAVRVEEPAGFRYLERAVARGSGPEIAFGSILGSWKVVIAGTMKPEGFVSSEVFPECFVWVDEGRLYFQLRGEAISNVYGLSRANAQTLYAEFSDSYRGIVEPAALFWGEKGDLVFVGLGTYRIEKDDQTSVRSIREPDSQVFSVWICRGGGVDAAAAGR